MKIDIIKASAKSAFKDYKNFMASPPQSIFSLAACTPEGMDLTLVDETMNMKPNPKSGADVAAIFMSTPDAVRGYELAQQYKKSGSVVVMGGLHPTFMTEEALQYADAVLIGESEEIWEELLLDLSNNTLKQRYERSTPVDMAQLNHFPTNLVDKKHYNGVWTTVVSRGCRFKCGFCLVTPFFKSRMRYRPIGDIVDEIKQSGAEWYELHSDNLTDDREYALELFEAIKPLNINWVGETTINIARDDELLHAAYESGLNYLLVGLETPSKQALKSTGKGFVKVDEVKTLIERIHEYDIAIDSAMIFGFDAHDTSIFKDSMDFARDIKLDVAHGVIMIPFPGSRQFEELDAAGRILTRDWSKYDGAHAVFKPMNMDTKELEKGTDWFNDNFYTFSHLYGKRSWVFW